MTAHFAVSLLSFMALFSAAACRSGKSPTTRPLSEDEQARELRRTAKWDERPLRVQQASVAVVEGPSPLAHIFDIGGPVRVVDLTSNIRLLSTDVPARTLVRVDDRNGVTVGLENLVPGPLPAGHRYGIFVDPVTPNVIRQGVGPAGDVPR
jgi:hypothetical protein